MFFWWILDIFVKSYPPPKPSSLNAILPPCGNDHRQIAVLYVDQAGGNLEMQMLLKADTGNAHCDGGKPVDLVHLAGQTMGDRALEAEVLRIFLSQAPAWMEALIEAGGHSARKETAHTLKGSARAIGAFRLAELAGEAELPAFVDSGALEAEFERVLAYIRTLI